MMYLVVYLLRSSFFALLTLYPSLTRLIGGMANKLQLLSALD